MLLAYNQSTEDAKNKDIVRDNYLAGYSTNVVDYLAKNKKVSREYAVSVLILARKAGFFHDKYIPLFKDYPRSYELTEKGQKLLNKLLEYQNGI